jgi:hypothetical protein
MGDIDLGGREPCDNTVAIDWTCLYNVVLHHESHWREWYVYTLHYI